MNAIRDILLIVCVIAKVEKIFSQVTQFQFFTFSDLGVKSENFNYVYLHQQSGKVSETLLAASIRKCPQYNQIDHEWNIVADAYDYSSCYNKQLSHFLHLNNTKNWCIGIFISEIHEELTWNLTVITSKSALCINSCNTHGICINNFCECNYGFIGIDCSIPVILISPNKKVSIYINLSFYIYFSITSNQDMSCNMTKTKGLLSIFSNSNKFHSNFALIPGQHSSEFNYSLDFNQHQFEIFLSAGSLTSILSRNSSILLTIDCKNSVDYSGENSMLVMWVLISVGGLSIIIWVFVALYKHFKRSNREMRVNPRANELDETQVKTFRVADEQDPEFCTICMDVLKNKSKIRELQCGHYFHKECIDMWLKEHSYCCICKREYEFKSEKIQSFREVLRVTDI